MLSKRLNLQQHEHEMREYKSRKWGAHDTCAAALRNAIQSDMINVYFLNRVADHVDALEDARNASLEEAAKLALDFDEYGKVGPRIAAAIRALKT